MKIVSKRLDDFAVEAHQHRQEGRDIFAWPKDVQVDVYRIYEFEHVSEADLAVIEEELFDPAKQVLSPNLELKEKDLAFRYRQVTGQYNEEEQMVQQMIRHLLGFEEVVVHLSKVIVYSGLTAEQVTAYKNYFINPVEHVEIAFDEDLPELLESSTEELQAVEGFNHMSAKELQAFSSNFSMDVDDLTLCQDYFKSQNRQPKLIELKVIDTYWSDHCRHTTFNTEIDQIDIEAGPYEELFKTALADYLEKRQQLKRDDRPISLMDLGTIQAKKLIADGTLANVEISAEVNACALEIKVDVDGDDEDWILYFKNETHNHPTEIEPFGGASTCVGGGVRDPLSGRSWVYQAMRISGAKNPNLALEDTHPEKLSQRTISKKALEGNSDYANQIGVTGGFAEEVYHPGFEAKRLELGALVSAAPKKNVVRLEPQAGDRVVLLGGRTGRDGLGAAVGSSQIQTDESLESAGAEVQKGAAAVERKITRLFRRTEATQLIKRCNDFGAGGVAVAVGELTDGLRIDLDQVPVKYPGMHGGEIALAESQERMAVVVDEKDLEAFLAYAEEEDVKATVIAQVTEDKEMTMTWQGDTIIQLHREFLDSNGAAKHARVELSQAQGKIDNGVANDEWTQETVSSYMTDLNRANQQAMAEQFDGSIGRATILNPYGGCRRRTQELGMVSKLPVGGGRTTTTSGMAYGYHPDLASFSPFHGGFYAVLESMSRLVALGFNYQDIRLTFQEYFESLQDDPKRWGKPFLALLGANQAMAGLDTASIGGKDSMSGSFEDIDVPPTLISFAVAQGHKDYLVSRAFKQAGSQLILLENPLTTDQVVDLSQQKDIFQRIHQLAQDQAILAASTVGYNGLLKEIIEMSWGNGLAVKVADDIIDRLAEAMMGSFLLEIPASSQPADLFAGLNYHLIGQVQEGALEIGPHAIDLDELYQTSSEVFASVFDRVDKKALDLGHHESFKKSFHTDEKGQQALVPVLYGTNGEYDMADALLEAGFEVRQLVIADSSHAAFEASIDCLIAHLKESQLLAFANGPVFGNEADEIGRAWEIILKRSDVKEAIHQHLDQKRLIMGSGSSLAALIRTGLIENGRITGQSSIRILPNPKGKFISDIVTAQVLSDASVYSQESVGQTYTAPITGAWGRIDLGEQADELLAQGQVISRFKSYHSEENIDALASPDGLVFGSLSPFERNRSDLYRNVTHCQPSPFIQKAYDYFNQ